MSARELIRLEGVPVYQNKMFDACMDAQACARGDVVLVQDPDTGMIRNIAFDAMRLEYDDSYQNEQAHSAVFKTHLSEVLSVLDHHFRSASILEIGCGKGAFLDQLRQHGHDARGVDPAYQGDSAHIIKAHFQPGLGISSDAIVMRHVLEHIPQPLRFLESIRDANGGTGKVYIEVPCMDWILSKRAWFDVFYEHVNYFRVDDFNRIFGTVYESGHFFGGQYLYAVADLASLRDPASPGVPAVVPNDFFASIDACAARASHSSQHVVWGAAAKGVMFAHHMLARGLSLDFAIDINPAKQGRFLAGSGLAALSPRVALTRLEPGSDIFVMNSNYIDEIRATGGPAYNYIPVDMP